jgi:hypothetical protein
MGAATSRPDVNVYLEGPEVQNIRKYTVLEFLKLWTKNRYQSANVPESYLGDTCFRSSYGSAILTKVLYMAFLSPPCNFPDGT